MVSAMSVRTSNVLYITEGGSCIMPHLTIRKIPRGKPKHNTAPENTGPKIKNHADLLRGANDTDETVRAAAAGKLCSDRCRSKNTRRTINRLKQDPSPEVQATIRG